MGKSATSKPRMAAFLNTAFMPVDDISVTVSAYGVSDLGDVVTPCASATVDYGAISQQGKYIPLDFKVYGAGSQSSPYTVLGGFLDDIVTSYDKDTITLNARGALAQLVDYKLTTRAKNNTDIAIAIADVINLVIKPPLSANVNNGKPAGINVGNALFNNDTNDYSSVASTISALDYINGLAVGVGWTIRVIGNVITVGPPNLSAGAPTISKNVSMGELLTCEVRHSALHASNIHVRVVSYLPRNKGYTNYTSSASVTSFEGDPFQAPTPAKTATNAQSSGSQNVEVSGRQDADTNTEEYVIPVNNRSRADCLIIANNLLAELSRKEFILTVDFSPTTEDIVNLSTYGCEVFFQLSGCSQASHNGMYYPKHIEWTWSPAAGLKISMLCFNHVTPPPTGGLANTTGAQ